MWKFDRVGDELTLLCFASKTADGVFDTSDRRLRRPEFIDYFNSLVDAATYVSVDAMNDPVLQPMRESYLVANNVVSMLDAAFVLNNRTYGMVCCEEPQRREWTASDTRLAAGDRQQDRAADVECARHRPAQHAVAAVARPAARRAEHADRSAPLNPPTDPGEPPMGANEHFTSTADIGHFIGGRRVAGHERPHASRSPTRPPARSRAGSRSPRRPRSTPRSPPRRRRSRPGPTRRRCAAPASCRPSSTCSTASATRSPR